MRKSDARERRYSVVIRSSAAQIRQQLERYQQLSYSTELSRLGELNKSVAESYREFVESYRRYLEAVRATQER